MTFGKDVARKAPRKPATILPADLRQGRLVFKIAGILVFLASVGHLLIGARPTVVLASAAIVLISFVPLAYFGVTNLGAVLIALVGFRCVGFAMFAKLAFGQPLDSNLLDPEGSFTIVLYGILGYFIAFLVVSFLSVGKPLLQPVTQKRNLGQISIAAAVIGIVADVAVASRAGQDYTGVTVAVFFTSFLFLALIAGVARALVASHAEQSIDGGLLFCLLLASPLPR